MTTPYLSDNDSIGVQVDLSQVLEHGVTQRSMGISW